VVLFAPSLTPCFYGGHGRRAGPGNVVSMYMTHAASRLDPPYQFAWTVFISWIFVATAIVELKTRRRLSPVSRNPRTFGRCSHSQALYSGVPPEHRCLSSGRLWLLEVHFRRPHIVFGTGVSAWGTVYL